MHFKHACSDDLPVILVLTQCVLYAKDICHKPYRKPVRRLGDGVEGGGKSSGDITDLPMPAMTWD